MMITTIIIHLILAVLIALTLTVRARTAHTGKHRIDPRLPWARQPLEFLFALTLIVAGMAAWRWPYKEAVPLGYIGTAAGFAWFVRFCLIPSMAQHAREPVGKLRDLVKH